MTQVTICLKLYLALFCLCVGIIQNCCSAAFTNWSSLLIFAFVQLFQYVIHIRAGFLLYYFFKVFSKIRWMITYIKISNALYWKQITQYFCLPFLQNNVIPRTRFNSSYYQQLSLPNIPIRQLCKFNFALISIFSTWLSLTVLICFVNIHLLFVHSADNLILSLYSFIFSSLLHKRVVRFYYSSVPFVIFNSTFLTLSQTKRACCSVR